MKNNPKIPKNWNYELAYLFGLLLGDGSLPYCFTKNGKNKQKRFQINFF